MRLDYFLIASYAEHSEDGKLSMIGGALDMFRCPSFPATLALPMYIAARIFIEGEEVGVPHTIRFELLAPNGDLLESTEHAVPPNPIRGPGTQLPYAKIHATLIVAGVTFPAPGEASARLLVDGQELRRNVLIIEHIPTTG